MRRWLAWMVLGLLMAPGGLRAAEYKVQALSEAPPAGKLASDVAARLNSTGYVVLDENKKPVCEVWLAKDWTVKADFQPSDSVLFPLEVGSLVGALRFAKKGADFRGQEIPAGVYTLRYANQPVDGNHVGTFDTRDFLLLTPGKDDASPAAVAEEELFKVSAESAGSSHPAIMPLVKPDGETVPELRHIEEKEWWTLRVAGQGADGQKVPLELIVVGKAAE